MSEVRRRWVVEDQVGGESIVSHVAFILLAEVSWQGVEASPANQFSFRETRGTAVCVCLLVQQSVRCLTFWVVGRQVGTREVSTLVEM